MSQSIKSHKTVRVLLLLRFVRPLMMALFALWNKILPGKLKKKTPESKHKLLTSNKKKTPPPTTQRSNNFDVNFPAGRDNENDGRGSKWERKKKICSPTHNGSQHKQNRNITTRLKAHTANQYASTEMGA